MPFINRIRLPLKISTPQYVDEAQKYRKANGVIVVLSNVIRKQYVATTDYMPDKLHERLKVAIAHQVVNVEGERYVGGVAQEGAYDINWPDFLGYPLGQATVKLEATPFNASSNNCGTCADFNQVSTVDDEIGTIGEDETVNVAILYNDTICCSPFVISVVTFNSTYLDSCVIVGNTLQLHTKTGLITQNNIVLATYRVTCDNGMFDEARVIANVEGTIEGCLSPLELIIDAVGENGVTTHLVPPDPAPACGYNWFLYESQAPGVPVQSGTTMSTVIGLTGLTASTDYRLDVQSNCCDDLVSNFVEKEFTTNPPSESGICGAYTIEFQDSCGDPSHYGDVEYLDCNDTYQNVSVFFLASPTNVCMKQTSPGNPVYYNLGSSNAPVECEIGIIVTYVGEC